MSKVCLKECMNNFLVLVSLFDMHSKLTLNLTFTDGMDQFFRCCCTHAYINPLDTFDSVLYLQFLSFVGHV